MSSTSKRSRYLFPGLAAALLAGSSMAGGAFEPGLVLLQEASTVKHPATQPPAEVPAPAPVNQVQGGSVVPGGVAPGVPTPGSQAPPRPNRLDPSGGAVVPEPVGEEATGTPAPPRQASRRGQDSGKTLSLQLDGAPIDSLIRMVMDELGYSYVIDPSVTGTVSIFVRGGVPKEAIFGFLEEVLRMNGFAIVERGPEFYAIIPQRIATQSQDKILLPPGMLPPNEDSAKGAERSEEEKKEAEKAGTRPLPPVEPPTGEPSPTGESRVAVVAATPTPLTPQQQPGRPSVLQQSPAASQIEQERGVITYVIPLNFIPSSEFLKMAQVYMSDGATVVDFAPSNIIMITDYRRNIQQVLNLVDLLDTRYFDINSIDLVPIRFNQAKDVAEDLGKIFAPDSATAGVRIVAIERLNSILVVTHGAEVLEEVRGWIEKLDSTSSSSNIRTYIYEVENNTADNIATVLAELYSDGFGLPSSTTPSGPEPTGQAATRPGAPRQEAGFVPEAQQPTAATRRGERGRGPAGQQQTGAGLGPSLGQRPTAATGIRAVVSGNVKIIVNEFNNSLIIQSSEADYRYLLDTIQQLDILPRQVVIEAEIYAVRLSDTLSFGVLSFLERLDAGALATTGSISGMGLSAATRTVIGDSRQFRAVVSALRGKTDVQMLDAPRIVTMDGVQASINVGADVPVSTSSFSDPLQSGSTGFVNQIQFRPTGTTLLIVPRISASGIVTLELSIEISSSSSSGADETNLTPTITRSAIETTLLCRDTQTVALGGIISESHDEARNRIPLLGDIPVFGALFGNTVKTKNRFELIFMITPHVIQSLPTAVELTLDFKRALRNSYKFIEEKGRERRGLIEERKQRELNPPQGND